MNRKRLALMRNYIEFQRRKWDMMTNDATALHLEIIRDGSSPNDKRWIKWGSMMMVGSHDETESKAIRRILR